jgi:hypothetical protein
MSDACRPEPAAADAARRAVNRSVKEAALEMVKDPTDEIQMMMVMLDQRGGMSCLTKPLTIPSEGSGAHCAEP